MKKKLKSFLNILLDVFIILFMVFSVFVLVVSLSQKTEEPGGRVSSIFGYSLRNIVSESMEPYNMDGTEYEDENAFYKGDLLICKLTDEDPNYEIDDVILFWMPVFSDGTQCEEWAGYDNVVLTAHEIVRIETDAEGNPLYYTQGLNMKTNYDEDKLPKTAEEIVAVYNGTKLSGFGNITMFVQGGFKGLKTGMQETDGWGFFLCIFLPIAIFVIIQTIRVIRNFITYKAQKATVAVASGELTEEQKRLIAEEYLKQQNASKNNATPSTDAAPADEAISVEEETPTE